MDDGDFNSSASANVAPPETVSGSRWTFARHWRDNVGYYGLARHLLELASGAWRTLLEFLPSRRKASFGDLDFDWEHSVDTTRSNVGFRTQLFTGLAGRHYFATEPWLFQQIMQAMPTDFTHFTFVDLGSGKGRVLLMASDYGFQRIVGVEFVAELHRVAEKNIVSYANARQLCRQIKSLCMDAHDFQFPADPLVVYLFNPFAEPTFAYVLESLRVSVEQRPRPVYIAYRFTEFDKLLAQANWLEKVAATEQWAVYRNRALT